MTSVLLYVQLGLVVLTLLIGLIALGEIRLLSKSSRVSGPLREGSHAPIVTAIDLATQRPVDCPSQREGMLIFLRLECPTCRSVASVGDQALLSQLTFVCAGDIEACRGWVPVAAQGRTVVDQDGLLRQAYGIVKFPTAVLLRDGRIGTYGNPHDGDELRLFWESRPSASGNPLRVLEEELG